MPAKVFSRVSFFEAQRNRSRVRKILIETLERRELLAADSFGCHSPDVESGWIQTFRQQSQFSFSPMGPSEDGMIASDPRLSPMGGVSTSSFMEQPWFDMVREDYDRWSREQGLQFTMSGGIDGGGLVAEGEGNLTALDLYVAAPDPSYSFSIVNTIPGIGFTLYDLEMTSQTWRTPEEVTWDVWRHRMSIVVPSVQASTKSLLVIGGGGHGGTGGHGGSAISGEELSAAVALSVSTGTVVSAVSNVPYQPLQFQGEAFDRSEDALIAKSYRRYLDGGDEFWPALLPMVKSAVRAMDTVQTVASEQHSLTVTDFVVTGGSKRGWTTWLTAAVDPRVSAIAPQVINVLNMDEQMEHHRMAYEGVTEAIVGGYSAWVQDYVNEGIFDEFGTPRGEELLRIVDPFEYRDRLTMPKFMINATGDQFFVPDSDQFFFDELLGQKYLRYIPNYGHGLGPDAITSLRQFYQAMVSGTSLPQFSWSVQSDGSIEITTADTPAAVRLWQSTNLINRDFRQGVSSTVWTDTVLSPASPGLYVARVAQPPSGHTAFMVELTYNIAGEPMKFTTEVSVVSADADSQFDFGPRLLSVAPNSGVIFSFNETNVVSVAPTELVLRFDDSIDVSQLEGIHLWAAGKDGAFGDDQDRMIVPGWIGAGETDRIIVMRFSEPLEDDLYRLQLLADGPNAVRNLEGETIATRALDSTPGDRSIESVDFRLQLGARVLGVVPQPVNRLANGALEPQRDVIRVYFNDDDLHATPVMTGEVTPNPTVVDPAYYQLIFTNDTVQPGDDQVFSPVSIFYDPETDVAELTFSQPIDQLIPGGGTFRLRIGARDAVSSTTNPPTVQVIAEGVDAGGTIDSSSSLGTFNSSTTILINGHVLTTSPDVLPLDFPGSNFEPGHRDIQDETHLGGVSGPHRADADPRITTAFYNFALNRSYGNNAAGQPVFTAITPEQMQRVREIFDTYSRVMGIDFIESEDQGMTIVVGDLFPLGGVSGAGILGIANVDNLNGLAIMDGAQTWDNRFGIPGGSTSFFSTAIHEIGHLLGLGHSYELPSGTIMGNSPELVGPPAYSYPGDHDIAHGLHLYRRDNRDVDMYSFVVPAGQGGSLSLEVLAERLANASNLDSHLTLFRRVAGRLELVAANSGSFGRDAVIQVDVPIAEEDTTYFVAITAKGNHDFNPEAENTGSGGVSEGAYQLRVGFHSSVPAGPASYSIVDVDGTPLDGNGDGTPGGNFNFWFRTVAPSEGGTRVSPRTIFVNKSYAGTVSNGSPLQPMKNLNFASWPASLRPQVGDIVRVAGAPNPIEVSPGQFDFTNIPAYEFGRGGVGNQVLADGLTLQVPRGVTLMVDAGNIFKLQGSQITTGSQTAGIDNSDSALQVLGTPHRNVFFTSYRDETLGVDTNPLSTTPGSGDWGGIHFRNSVDAGQGRFGWERNGIFLDYISGAHVQYGGGQVTVLNPSPVVAPITLSESRPTILNNVLRDNADAAISADPNSFRETLFTTPRYQSAELFAPDYSRVGPFIRGNKLDNNSINGLFVRTVTAPGAPLTTLDFAAKFDDTDIVHVISENLIINSFPGGNMLETRGPDLTLLQIQQAAEGSLPVGSQVRYRLTATDRWGQSGVSNEPTAPFTVGAGGAVRLVGLPAVTGDFVGRSLWRSIDGGDFELVAELDRNTSTFNDLGLTRGGVLPNINLLERGRPNARLEIAPGTIVKLSGSRIETSIGARLIAEGTPDRPIIFTSRSDDRYGAGGTFDTFNDGNTNPSAGDWGGLVARHLSKLSLDHVLLTYGGGLTSLPGGFSGFNAVEVHQSTARIANSRFEMNQTGVGGNLAANRVGRGPNTESVIYVVGSQPVIMDNVFRDNSVVGTAAISINANAMNAVNVIDHGRQTGTNQRKSEAIGNQGPLVRGNAIGNTGINGMVVRGKILTTESIWDDTDIVHVLMSEIIVPDFHTYGGLTLRSRVDESLVVKLAGEDAGFTAMGRPLDITDRIGGSLRVLGSPGFPVVLTSLSDDTVGAGFDPFGRELVNTNNSAEPSTGSPGQWRSVRFEPYANDRNVAMLTERESDQLQDDGSNDSVEFAQDLGYLADRLSGGDENLRLGFNVDGAIASPSDLDVYSFSGTAGTMVWLDIDRTSGSLDAVLELLDADGNILAQSASSLYESLGWNSRYVTGDSTKILPSQVMGLDADPFAPRNSFNNNIARDFHSLNPHDPGMRVILPGTPGETSTYFVRVRSSNVPSGSDPSTTARLQDSDAVREGLTTGTYRLQVRLRQTTEIPGSTVKFADIRYAINGIEAFGMPASSPLLGQVRAASATGPNSPGGAALGNVVNSDRGSITVAGNLTQPRGFDEYTFTISRDSIQSLGNRHVAVTFDINYADGFGGPDTTLWVFNSNDELVYVGTNSNIVDDQPAPLRGNDLTDMTRGSGGRRDAFIGPVELPDGDYRVLVANNSLMARAMEQYFFANTDQNLVRLEPINSVRRLAVHRFDQVGFETATAPSVTQVLFDANPQGQMIQWNLADVTTYVVRNFGAGSELVFANAMTGARVADVSRFPRVNDAAMSPDGRLVGYQVQTAGPTTDANAGNFLLINSTGALDSAAIPTGATQLGSSGIQTFTAQQTGFGANPTFAIQQRDQNPFDQANTPVGDGIVFNALSFYTNDLTELKLFGVGSRGNGQISFDFPTVDENGNVNGIDPTRANFNTTNIVYRLDPFTGAAINPQGIQDRDGNGRVLGAGTNKVEFGRFLSGTLDQDYTDGVVTGLAQIGNTLYAVSNLGELFVAPLGGNGATGFGPDFSSADPSRVYSGLLPLPDRIVDPETGQPIAFAGLTAGPRNIHADILFGTTADGTIYAFDTDGSLAPVFPGFSYKTKSESRDLGGAVAGLDFSPLDVNLWHLSELRAGQPGNGRPATFDQSQVDPQPGERSLYFGFRDTGSTTRQQGQWSPLYDGFYNETYNLPGGAHGAIVTKPFDLSNYSANDLPMLYFNYLLETEEQNNDFQQNGRMRDAFRVYGAANDGQWVLLATNNTPLDGGQVRDGRNGNTDELDNGVNGNFDSLGFPIPSQELFDNSGWRQARVPLGVFAGSDNVRLRFEFSTSGSFGTGDPLLGGIELTAVAASRITDGTGFAMAPGETIQQPPVLNYLQPTGPAFRFEFDLGLVLAMPSGASLADGFAIDLDGTRLEFSPGVDFQITDSPSAIAAVVRTAIQSAGLPGVSVTTNSLRSSEIAVAGVELYSIEGFPDGVLQGEPGVADTWTDPDGVVTLPVRPIPINFGMDANGVGAAMRGAFAEAFGNPDMLANFGLNQAANAWPHHENIVRLHKYVVLPNFNDSFVGVTTARVGDSFGVDPRNPSASSFAHRDEGALNNSHLGVFIDDIIIGFAERGEMVFSSQPAGGQNPFVLNREYDQNLYDINQIETGRYQLTIRTAADYGTTNPATGELVLLRIPPFFVFGRDFDTNDRLSQSVGIQVNADAAGQIADGTTFTLTDTKHSLTFEFDVSGGPGDPAFGVAQGHIPISISLTSTPEQIADAIRDAINSLAAQNVVNITANVRGQLPGSTVRGNSRIVELHGRAAADTAGGWQFSAETHLTALRWGDNSQFGEDLGDVERERPQGQLLLMGNTITDAAQWGIVASAGDRVQPFGKSGDRVGVGDRPYPGAPINFPSPNAARLAAGVVVMNNILANNTSGGLRVSGDPGIDATVQIARVANNTFYAGADGLLIEGGASPTVLNNIFAQTGNAVRGVGANSAVLGANLYQGNGVNTVGVVPGTFDIALSPTDPLFVNPDNRRFYLAAGSRAIDASLESLQERDELTQVKGPLGLPLSPLLAPDRDINGILRVDDPAVNSPDGLGGNVFKDRGAVERADFVGPVAVIVRPRDNDALGLDIDRNQTYIAIEDFQLDSFSVLLQDVDGVGPDPDSVLPSAITLTENGRILRQDFDYVLGYNTNTRVLRFTPLAGVWRQDSVYEITLNNSSGHRLLIPAAASVTDGDTISIVRGGTTMVLEFDSDGQVADNAIAVPFSSESTAYQLASGVVYAINRQGLSGLNARLEGGGQLMIQGATQVATSSILDSLILSSVGAIRDLAGNRLQPNRATGLTQFTIMMPEALLDFGDASGSGIPTTLAASEAAGNGARHVILPVDVPQLTLGAWSGPDLDGRPSLAADGDDYSTVVDFGTLGSVGGISQGAAGPARLILPAAAGLDGQRIVIEDTGFVNLPAIVFEFDASGSAVAEPNKVIVDLDPADSAEDVAEKFSQAVREAVLEGRLTRLTWDWIGNEVSLGGTSQHRFDLSAATSVQRLSAGNVEMVIPGDLSNLAVGQSMSITDSVGRVLVFELTSNSIVAPGNIPVTVDLGTASPETVAAAFAQAISQQIAERRIWLGGAVASGATVTIIGDDEDGISFGGPFNSASAPVPVFVRSTGFGMLDAWIDWNGNGSFNDAGDRLVLLESPDSTVSVATSVPVRPGLNVFYVRTPANAAVGLTTARFRLSALGGLLPGGVGIGGEVEDHRIEILGGQPPIADSDLFDVNEDNVLIVSDPLLGILANDSDPDIAGPDIELGVNLRVHDENPGTPEIVPLVNVSFGSLVLFADGTFTYTPALDFNGTDYFVYRATDGRLISTEPATVTITVNPVNDQPLAIDDEITILEDQVIDEPGETFTANDFPHFRMALGVPGFHDNEAGQALSVIDAVIVSEVVTDLGVAGTAVRIASRVGQGSYGNSIIVETSDLGIGALPLVSVVTRTVNGSVVRGHIHVTLNSNSANPSTVGQLVEAINLHPEASTLIEAILESGEPGLTLGDQPTSYSPLSVPPSGGSVSVVDNRLQYTPPADYNNTIGGPAIVRLTIADDDSAGMPFGLTSTSTLTINIQSVNDAPTFEIPNPTVEVFEDVEEITGVTPTVFANFATHIASGPATALDEVDQQLEFEIVSISDPSLFSQQPSLSSDGTLSFQTAQDRNGIALVVVRLVDDGPGDETGDGDSRTSAEQTITINIIPVNDAPVFDLATLTVTSIEDQGLVSFDGFLTGVLPGPSTAIDEQDQIVTITVEAFEPAAFIIQPSIDSNGRLTFQTGPDVNSSNADLRVRLTLTDDGPSPVDPPVPGSPPHVNSAEVIFTISAQPINDPPVFDLVSQSIVIDESLGIFEQPGFAINIGPGPVTATDEVNQAVNFEIVAIDNPSIFSELPSLSPEGTLRFQTAPFRNGSAQVVVRLVDDGASSPPPNNNASSNQTFTVTIRPVNDPPEFTIPSTVTVLEDAGLVTVPSFATGVRPGPIEAVDEQNQLVTFEVEAVDPTVFTVQPTIVSLGFGWNLSFQVAPNVNSANVALDGRSLAVRVRLIDDGPNSPPPNNNTSPWQTFTVNVTPVNDPPESPDFVVQTDEGTPLTLLASEILVNASGGPTSDEADQRVWITQVEATSARGGSITPVFNAAGTELVSVTYVPPPNAVGTDSFVFIMRDDGVPSRQGTARVIIQIAAVNDPPQFVRGPNQTVFEDAGPIVVENWATDILPGPPSAIDEIESQTVSFELIVDRPELFLPDGQPAISGTGRLTFQTAPDANGVAVVRVVAVDDGPSNPPNNNRSVEELLTITILPVNDPPVFTSGGNVTVLEDSGFYSQPWATNIAPAAGLLADPPRALDEADQTVSFTVQADRPELFAIQPSVSSDGVLSFQAAQNAFGSVVLTIRAVDSGPSQAPNQNTSEPVLISLTIIGVNDPPVAVDDFYTTDENSVLSIAAPGVLVNDFDIDFPDDEIFAVAGSLQSSFGAVVVLNEDGSFTYDPRDVLLIQQLTTGQSVIDTFVYQIRDLAGAISNQATVFITVNGIDDPPVAVDDFYTIAVGQTVLLDVLSNDFDIDTAINPASIQIVTLPIFGSVTVRATGLIEYVPSPGFQGTEVFGYTVRDMGGNVSNEALVTIVIGNPPVAGPDLAITNKDEPVLISVLQNDVAGSNPIDPASVRIVTPPSFGDAQVQANGSILYTPAPGFAGDVTFTYVVADTLGLTSAPAAVTVRVLNSRWQNPSMPLDVSGDGRISALDALLVINYLNSDQPRDLPGSGVTAPPFVDVNGDERVSALDALLIINYLNERSIGGGVEGEASLEADASNAAGVDWALMVTAEQMVNTVGARVRDQMDQALSGERELAIQALRICKPLNQTRLSNHRVFGTAEGHFPGLGDSDKGVDADDLQSLAEWMEATKGQQTSSRDLAAMIDLIYGNEPE